MFNDRPRLQVVCGCAFHIVTGEVVCSRARAATSAIKRPPHLPRQRAAATTLARVAADFVLGGKHDPQRSIADVLKVVAVHLSRGLVRRSNGQGKEYDGLVASRRSLFWRFMAIFRLQLEACGHVMRCLSCCSEGMAADTFFDKTIGCTT